MNKITEHQAQAAYFRWAEEARRYPGYAPLVLLHAIPNAAKRSLAVAASMKAEGLRAGVPDVCLPVNRMGYSDLRIEFKVSGGRLREMQVWWLETLYIAGSLPVVVWGVESAIWVTEAYLRGDERLVNAPGYAEIKDSVPQGIFWTRVPGTLESQIRKLEQIEADALLEKLRRPIVKKGAKGRRPVLK